MEKPPFFTNDAIVFGLLMIALGFVFYTSSQKSGFWKKFYSVVPALLMCYLLPAIMNSVGLVDDQASRLYFVASRYLLPASLVLMTLSIDLKAIFNLGPKALIMFFAGTVGIIIGGPLAILLISAVSPETVGGVGPDAIWRGLSTIAGSWIGGGANQAAMLEIYEYNPDLYGGMVLVDIVVANLWMAVLLMGIGKNKSIDRWLKADDSAINQLKEKVSSYAESITRNPSLADYMIMLSLAFGAVGIAHWGADGISHYLSSNFAVFNDNKSALSSFSSSFFWMITIATAIGILLSFTRFRSYEGAGASKIGSLFIYILVATIGMKMDLGMVFDNPGPHCYRPGLDLHTCSLPYSYCQNYKGTLLLPCSRKSGERGWSCLGSGCCCCFSPIPHHGRRAAGGVRLCGGHLWRNFMYYFDANGFRRLV